MRKAATTHIHSPKAYSYLRFSTPEQARGDSHRRQSEAAQVYAAKHGLELDETLTFQDLGVSAFRGDNAETGRLGDFLEAVRKGVIPRGSYLLVESLDRVSRLKARKAMRLLEQICEAGITLVTLADGKTYTEEVLDDDPMAFMWAFMVAIRANEESETKGRRLRASWANKRSRATEHVLTARAPKWLNVVGSGKARTFEINEERANVVRRVYALAAQGVGQHKIAGTLNREKVPTFDGARMWHRSLISKWFRSAAVIGTYLPHTISHEGRRKVRNPQKPVENYYPPIVDAETFRAVAAMYGPSAGRAKHTSSGGLSNMLAGLARCAICGGTMTRVNKTSKRKGGRTYLVCTSAKAGAGCDYHAVPQEEIEAALVEASKDFQADAPATDASYLPLVSEIDHKMSAAESAVENIMREMRERGPSPRLRKELDKAEAQMEEWGQKSNALYQQMAQGSERLLRENLEQAWSTLNARPRDVTKINTALRKVFTHAAIDWRYAVIVLHWRHLPEANMRIRYADAPRPRVVRGERD